MSDYYFISYSRADGKGFARKLRRKLSSVRPPIQVWLDEEQLHAGLPDWDAQVSKAIHSSKGLLFVMTEDSVTDNSECKSEWVLAQRCKKPIFPLLFDRRARLPYRLGSRQYVDFSGAFKVAFDRLCRDLNWIDSPEGVLQEMENRLIDAKRELRRAEPQHRPRIEHEIDELRQQIAGQRRVVEDPQRARQETDDRIKRGLERERQSKPRVPGAKFINPPPAAAPSWFQDRVVETELIGHFLKDEALRLMTVVGRPGIGKTVMVCRLLRSLESGKLPDNGGPLSVDGIVYLSGTPLHPLTLSGLYTDLSKLLSETDAGMLNAIYENPQLSIEAKMQALLEAFPAGRTIVLLNHFEDAVDTETGEIRDGELDRALRAFLTLPQHGVKVILTTEVPPRALRLAEPGRQTTLPLDRGLESPYAENILRERDQDGRLGLRDAPDSLLAQVRQQTDGHPKALEALVSVLANDRDATLEEALGLLQKIRKNGAETLPEYLAEEFAGKAFSRLYPMAQWVMQALAVYAHPVPATAVDYLLQPRWQSVNSAPTLRQLADSYLVRRDTERRYRLHHIDRAYALDRLPRGQKSDRDAQPLPFTRFALYHRAAEYFRETRKPRESWYTIDDLAPQLLEFEHRMNGEDYTRALAIIDTIDYSWSNHHKYLASMMVMGHGKAAIEHRERLDPHLTDRAQKARNLTSLAWVCRRMGYKDKARQYFHTAVYEASQGDDPPTQIFALSELGYFLTDNDTKHDEAEEVLGHALTSAQETGDSYAEAHVLLGLAFVQFQRGRNDASASLAQKARDLFHALGATTPGDNHLPQYREIDCWTRLSMIYRKTGEYEKGIEVAHAGLQVARTYRLTDWEAELYSQIGFHHRALGKYGDTADALDKDSGAIAYHTAALTIFARQHGMKREEAVQHGYLGNLLIDLGRFDDAKAHYDEAERIAVAVGLQRELSWILGTRGILLVRTGDYDGALQVQLTGIRWNPDQEPVSALLIVQKRSNRDSEVIRHTDIAATYLAKGQYHRVQDHILLALQIAAELQQRRLSPALPAAYLEAPCLEDLLPHEMQSPGDHQRRGVLLARAYLHGGQPEHALSIIRRTREFEVIQHRHFTAALQGVICTQLKRDEEACELFRQAIRQSEEMIGKTPCYYPAKYTLGIAHGGMALLTSGRDREACVQKAVQAYGIAFENCGARGVVEDAIQVFDALCHRDRDSATVLSPVGEVLGRARS